MKLIFKVLGYCLLWLVIDIMFLFICYQLLNGQLYIEGVFRITGISLIGLVILATRNNKNILLLTSLILLIIVYNIYRMTGMVDFPQFSKALIFYDVTTLLLGLVCFFCILFFTKKRTTIYLTCGIMLISLWLAYSPLFNQFLKIANSQENIITDRVSFKFKTTSSNQVNFESCSENKITVVSLFTENCAFCFQEMKVLKRIEQMLNDTSILFISVHALTPYDSVQLKKVTSFVPFPIYHDSGLLLSKSLKIHGVPHLIILDKNHKIRYHKEGFSVMESDFLIQQLTDKITEIKKEHDI